MTIAELFAKLRIQPDKRSFDAADKMIAGLKTALIGLVAIKGAQLFTGFVTQTVELGGKIDDLAQSSGQTRQELQELAFAGEQGGMTMEDTSALVTKLSKNLFEAANGSKEMAKSFAKQGIAVRNSDGTLRSAGDALGDIADRIASLPDDQKPAVAMELLGRSGAKAIPLLNGGAEALANMRKEAHELGAVMSDETIKGLDELGDEQAKVKASLIGLRNEAVAALLPQLKEMVASLLAWVKANKTVIAQKLAAVIKMIVGALKIFAKIVGFVVDAIDFMGKHIDEIIIIIGSLITAIALFKVASISAAIASGIAWALSMLPIILLAAAIAAVILLVEDLYQWFTGGDSVLKDLWESFKEWAFDGIVGDWIEAMQAIRDAFKNAFVWIAEKIEFLYDKLTALKDALFGAVDLGGMTAALEEGKAMGLTGDALESHVKQRLGAESAPAPMISFPTNPPSSSSTTMSAPVTIQLNGGTGTPDENAKAITNALDIFWNDQMRQASSATGGGK